jgi:hypothetical protein
LTGSIGVGTLCSCAFIKVQPAICVDFNCTGFLARVVRI